jgi:hypothetical protein
MDGDKLARICSATLAFSASGLAIARGFWRAMGGAWWFNSDPVSRRRSSGHIS